MIRRQKAKPMMWQYYTEGALSEVSFTKQTQHHETKQQRRKAGF